MKIGVIGGGAAGVAASLELEKNLEKLKKTKGKIEVVLLEGNDRLGGRCRQTTVNGNTTVDLGATWVHFAHPEQNVAAKMAAERGLDLIPASTLSRNAIVFSDDYTPVSEESVKEGKRLWEASVDGNLLGSHSSDVETCFHFFRRMHENFEGGPVADLADDLDMTLEEHRYDGPHLPIRRIGYLGLLQTMADELKHTQILLSHRVVRIAKHGRKVIVTSVHDHQECTMEFDRCIVTIPLGVLQCEHETMFADPISPEKVRALSLFGSGVVEKIILHFSAVFWTCSTFGNSRYIVSSLDNYCEAPILVVWITRTSSLEPEDVAREIQTSWNAAEDIRLLGYARTAWGAGELSRGSYSYPRKGTKIGDRQALAFAEWDGLLHFAGEHCSEYQYGMVHGAMEEGIRAANQIISFD